MKNFNSFMWLRGYGLKRVGRILACLTLLLTLACGNVWGDDYTETYSNPTGSNPPARANGMGAFSTIGSVTGDVSFGNSSLQINTNAGSGTFTVSSTDGSYIESITFTQQSSYPVNSLTSSQGTVTGPSSNIFTFTPNSATLTSATFSMSAQSGKKVRIAPIVVNLTSDCEYFSKNFTISSGTVSCTKSNAKTDVTITSTGGTSNNGLTLASSGNALTIASSGHNIKAVHFTCESHNTMSNLSANTGTYSSNGWTKSTATNTVTFTSSGSNATIVGISVELEAGCTSISPSLSYTSTSLMVGDNSSAPTLDKDGSAGAVTWTSSDEDVATVNESTGVVTAVAAGTATITASIAANGGYCEGSATANFTVTRDPVGEDHELEWTVRVENSETTVTTTGKNSTSSYLTSMSNISIGGSLTVDNTGKNSGTGKIKPTSGDKVAANCLSMTFTVADGYTFTPSDLTLKTTAVSTKKTVEVEISDTHSHSKSATWAQSKSSSTPDSHDYDLSGSSYEGTVTIKIWVYNDLTDEDASANNGYRLGTPITLVGDVAAAAPSCSDDTGLAYGETTVNKVYGDASFTNTLTNSNSLSVTYSSSNTNVATVNESTGAVTIAGAGTTTITATWAGNATYCADAVSYTLNVKPNAGSVTGDWDRFGGETIDLSVSPTGGSSYTYQWQKWYNSQWNNVSNGTVDGSATSGATTNNLQITNCSKENSGSYRCQVTSASQTNETGGYQVKVYVLECYNGGTTVYNFTRDGENQRGSVTIDLAASTGYTFKVHADNDYYGNDGTINSDATNWVLCNNSTSACTTNLTVNSGLGGTFTFTMEYSTGGNSSVEGEPEISVTYPRKKIYMDCGDWKNDNAKMAVYYWRGEVNDWTDDFMSTYTCDDNVRYTTIPAWAQYLIFGRFNKTKTSTGNWDDKYNQSCNISPSATYDLYTFSGWSDCDGNSSFTNTSSFSETTFTISYNKGTGGSGTKDDESKTCGVDFTLPSSAVFTRTGYTQTGWTTSDGGAQEYALGGSYTDNEDKTFYPVWTVNNYDLTWNLGGGTTTSAGTGIASGVSVNTTSSVAYGTSLTAPTITKTGYNFSAWSPAVASTMPAANTTYTATWTVKTTTITINANTSNHGSTSPGSVTATYGSALPSFTAAAGVSGYSLTGYFTTATSGTKVINADGTLVASTDYADGSGNWKYETATLTLYPQYEEVASLTAISADVLYQAASMANITFTGSDQYWAGLSTNNLFQTYGDGTSNSAKGKTISSKDVTDDISTKSFTSEVYIEGSDVTSGTTDPTYGAIEFITPSSTGILYVYTIDGSGSNLKLRKKGSSTFTPLNGSSNYNAVVVDASSNYYIHGNSKKRGIYGIQYVSTYAVTITPTNVTKATGDGTAIKGKAYTATFTANTGYALPDDATVTIGGVEQTKGTGYTWTISAGTATLTVLAAKVTGAISIAVSGVALPTHTVSYNGNGSTSGDAPTDATEYLEGADVTVLGKNTLLKTNNGFAGWNTASDGSGTWRVQGETFSMGAADVALHAQWVPTANMTVGTLYTAGDMKAKAIGSSTGYRPGYSSNGIFELLGVGTTNDDDLKNSPMEYATDSRTIDGTAFTHVLHFKGTEYSTPSGTTLPTARAIKFHVGESGTLHLWVRAGNKINIVKDGGSAAAVGSSSERTHETVEVTAGTWYLYATGTSTSLYGMKLMTCTDPELAYGTTAVAKNYGDDAFTNPLTKAAGASPAFSSDNTSVATVIGTGEVTIVGVGSATITASISDDATYCDDEASYTLTVYPSYTVTYNAMGGTCGTASAVTELGKVTLPSATHGTYTTYTWVTYDGAFVGYEGEEYEPSGDITLYAKWQGDCAAGGGSDGVLFSAEFKDSGLGTSNICTAANDPVTFTTDQLKAEPIGGSISAYTTKDLTHVKYVDNGVYLKGTDGVIKITLDAAINTNDLFEYVNVHSSNPNAYLRHTSASNTTDQIVLTGYNSKNVKVMLPAAFNGKKELYIVKQSTDFKLHKAAVVRPAFLMLLRDDTPTTNTNLSGTDEALTTENYLEVIRGGSASYTSPTSGDLIIKRSDNKNYVQFNKSAGYLKITVSQALQEDDVIGFDSYNNNDLALTTTAEYSKSIHTTSQLYTVGSSSPLKGQTTFYIWQYSGSSDFLRGLQIARSAVVGSSCYAVIYEGNGADGGYTNDPKAYDDEHNDVVVLPNGYTRTGYEFVGWNTATDGSGTPYAPLETISDIDDDVTLYAQWRILITSDNTNFSGYTSVGATDDVRVANGATLTLTQDKTIHDITIETGSTLNVAKDGEDGITVATNSLHLMGGWNDSYTTYDMPRVYIDPASTLTKVVNTVNLDISVDANNYYPIAVPFRVRVKDVDYANSTLAGASTYGTHYVIKDYDGASRAENGPDQVNNWKVVPQKDEGENDVYLEPGRGYILTAVSIRSYGGGVIRFPMSFTNDWTTGGEKGTVSDVTKNVIAVTAHTGAAATSNQRHAGWNMLGVPFMSCYGAGEDMYADGTLIDGEIVVTPGDEDPYSYDNTTIPYVSVPSHDFAEYIQTDITDAELRPGWSFFVQVAESGDLTFAVSNQQDNDDGNPIYAPKRTAADRVLRTGIVLSGAETSDKTTILVSDKYSAADYEINADLEKLFGNGYTLATYSLSGSTRLAYNAMSKSDATAVIPIGYRAPADGEYTFSINPRYAENGAFSRVDLIDYETSTVTNLLYGSYTFESARTQNDTRFALNVVLKPTITTDVETISDEGLEMSGAHKMIIDDKLYIILDGKMYDATGKVVKGGQK